MTPHGKVHLWHGKSPRKEKGEVRESKQLQLPLTEHCACTLYIRHPLTPLANPARWALSSSLHTDGHPARRSEFLNIPQLPLSICQAFHVSIIYSIFSNHLLSVRPPCQALGRLVSGKQRKERILEEELGGEQKPKARTRFCFLQSAWNSGQPPVPKGNQKQK